MSQIFVSYRQQGTLIRTGRIADALVERFGAGNVFQDRATLHGGINWRRAIDAALKDCRVMIAVIGPDWLAHQDSTGARRIDDKADYVRYEIATALERDIPIIPVLVNGATRVRDHELPEPLRELAYIEPLTISDDDWRAGMRSLLDALQRFRIQRRIVEGKTLVALLLAIIGMLAVAPDEVHPIAAGVGLSTGLVSMALSLVSYRGNPEPGSSARNWGLGTLIFSALVVLAALDELIPDKYF